MKLPEEFKEKVRIAMLENRKTFGGTNTAYANSLGIHETSFSRLQKALPEGILADGKWISIARKLNIQIGEDKWVTVKTSVYLNIEENLLECQNNSISMVLVDACGIGKTYSATRIVKTMPNAFYVDCSQCKTKIQFIRTLATAVGVDRNGRYNDVKEDLKMALNVLEKPLIVLDEAGDLDYNAFLDLKELSNATVKKCGWYMMGADGLQAKINNGIKNKKVGFAEIFDRYTGKFIRFSPLNNDDKIQFKKHLLGSVAQHNVRENQKVNVLVRKCMDESLGLRFLETLIKINWQPNV
jgi:hypothetical protein